jgi:hypothetical protein
MFEHRAQPLLPFRQFVLRQVRYVLIATAVILGSLGIGAVGYHTTEGLHWLDSLHNAAMILTGMGPVDRIETRAGKIFAICYALYSGVAFLTTVGVMFAPLVHRLSHRFHLAYEEGEERV